MKKLPRTRPNILSLCFVSISLAGLFLLAVSTFSVPTLKVRFSWHKPVIVSIFGLICLLGIIAGVYPSKCSRISHFREKIQITSTGERATKFEGHHPSCGKFSAHVFQLNGKTYCAGCIGLVTGAIISLLGASVYFFTELFLGVGMVFFSLGFLWVTVGLLQYNLFNVHRSFIHLFLNVIFVLGAFLLLIGIEETTSNLVLESYLLTLILYWILTRVLLSQQEHRRICAYCGVKFCRYLG